MNINSPFKFLNAYTKEDKEIFFGRDDEIEQLYELVFQSNLTLVYGQSGTGKTSLVQCGLANRFAQSDWFNVYIRRNENINASMLQVLRRYRVEENKASSLAERLKRRRKGQKRNQEPLAGLTDLSPLIETIRKLYKYYLKPIYLIFDQFEELYILGNRQEQITFFQSIAEILDTEPYVKIIFIMREEAIAELYNFEKVVPHLFEKRLRVEPMSRTRTEEVIEKTCKNFDIHLEADGTADEIIKVLGEDEGSIQLTYLQVFLERLYQEAALHSNNGITFNNELIQKLGGIEDVLGDFLQTQTSFIQGEFGSAFRDVPNNAVNKVLNSFVTLEGTKRPLSKDGIPIGKLNPDHIDFIVNELERSRILRLEGELYELSHDSLAKHIADQRSTDEIAILRISKMVKDRYSSYENTQTYLSHNEIQLAKSYQKSLEEEQRLGPEEWGFYRKSVRVNRRKRAWISTGVVFVILSLTAFSIGIALQSNQIKQQAKKLQETVDDMKAANYIRLVSIAKTNMVETDYHLAVSNFDEAIKVYEEDEDVAERTLEADSLREIATQRLLAKEEFDLYLDQGDSLFNSGNDRNLVIALEQFMEAEKLNYDPKKAKDKIEATRDRMKGAYENFKSAGEAFYRAGGRLGQEDALDAYEEAKKIEKYLPTQSTEVSNRIAELKRKLGK